MSIPGVGNGYFNYPERMGEGTRTAIKTDFGLR